MSGFAFTAGGERFRFADLKQLLAKATPARSGDQLAGLAADSGLQRVAAQMALADLPLQHFLQEAVVPYEADEVTRLIIDQHDAVAFAAVAHLTVGGFRDWLLSAQADEAALTALAPGLTPEMVAAVSKLMRVQDLILVAQKTRVVTRFRNTLGLRGRLSTRLQPNHPTDDATGIAASVLDGLLYGNGDAVIGINPASDSLAATTALLRMLDAVISGYHIPTQSCVLAHITTTIEAIGRGVPVDLVFQSIAGTEAANASFGINLALLQEGYEAGLSLRRGNVGDNVMYFETGQGSALSANAHHGVDQQTCEVRAYAVARHYKPLLVNTVVGFIGPEYLYDGKQIIRAGLEDHFCGKLLGVPMGWRHLLHQSCRSRSGRHGYVAHPARYCRHQFHHGHSRLGRCDAELPDHLVSRCAVCTPGARPARCARVRTVAGAARHPAAARWPLRTWQRGTGAISACIGTGQR